ncbi:NAD(P)-dependent dehydrogenase (short-subunit alcohol dehydrogenase family) [Parvibaculum indicum]|uniref:SDR family NAD(P)-dependent oxidoreductase n=1 Tax=Parvibaculum indicum TaxID=562969 RepID=UPI00141E6D38|nr:SDR family oxidoreductase [Parvibaculum indicum]NIJ42381.1 NAD(P)-dependent dehydrogenase (short-subunit alcohol dehydrogenase family) [Parvibaculum indicum]
MAEEKKGPEKQGYVRPLSAESEGDAPGRGRLEGRRILVVGGGQRVLDAATDPVGNGRAMSLLFAREGAEVAVADMNAEAAAETVRQAEVEGGKATAIAADIAKPDDITRMIDEAISAMGGLDGMVLNVGVGVGGLGLDGISAEDWTKALDVNLRGPMLCCQAALPKMEEGSSIVFISSIAGLVAGSRLPAYDASKAALGGLMRHVGLEGAKRGIRANIVAPGLVDTPLGRLATQGRPSRRRTPVPFGRQATGWEIAYAALFFISDESVYVTGQTLAVDSGLTGIS